MTVSRIEALGWQHPPLSALSWTHPTHGLLCYGGDGRWWWYRPETPGMHGHAILPSGCWAELVAAVEDLAAGRVQRAVAVTYAALPAGLAVRD